MSENYIDSKRWQQAHGLCPRGTGILDRSLGQELSLLVLSSSHTSVLVAGERRDGGREAVPCCLHLEITGCYSLGDRPSSPRKPPHFVSWVCFPWPWGPWSSGNGTLGKMPHRFPLPGSQLTARTGAPGLRGTNRGFLFRRSGCLLTAPRKGPRGKHTSTHLSWLHLGSE